MKGRSTKRAITSETWTRSISHILSPAGVFAGEVYGALEACSVEQSAMANQGEGSEEWSGPAKHCALIDVSNPDRIVPTEINGARVKKQNTCLCCRSTHRR